MLIFDGIGEEPLQSTSIVTSQQVGMIGYLPPSKLSSIVLTTLHNELFTTLEPHHIVELKGLTPEMAQKILERSMGTTL